MPLQRLTAAGSAVLVLHHPSKGDPAAGQAARGSGALAGYVDVLVEMKWVGRPMDDDRRRRLTAFSRFSTTPARLVIELSADGTDYAACGDVPDEDVGLVVLTRLLTNAPGGLTRQQVRERWPAEYAAPAEVTLWRWLERAARCRDLTRTGTGRRSDPFRFRLPTAAEKGGGS